MKRTSFHNSDQGPRGPWVHLGAAFLLCLAAAALVILCVLATPAHADESGQDLATDGSDDESGDWNGDGIVDLLDLDAAVAGSAIAGGAIDRSDLLALIDRISPTVTGGLASGLPFASEPESPLRIMQAAPPWVIENAAHCARLTWAGPSVGAAVIEIPRDGGPGGSFAASIATDDIETATSLFWIDNRVRFTVCASEPSAQSAIVTSVGAPGTPGTQEANAAGPVSVTIGPVLIVEDGVRVVYTEKVTVQLARTEPGNSENGAPVRTGLLASYPNPFNPAVTIPYELAVPSRATLSIYDALGRRVTTLIENDQLPAGPGSVVWRGRDANGRSVSSGAYFAVLTSGAVRDVRTMILLR